MSQRNEIDGHLIIPKDKVPVAAYQAIYHKLTSKVEKLHEIFDSAYEIGVQDIVQLHEMLCQTIRQYPVQESSVTVSISFHRDERMESSSVEKFRILNFSTNKPTELVEYKFDFYTVLPVEIADAQDIVQRFKVTVSMDQDFMEEDEGRPFFLRGMVSGSNIRLLVEYADYAVGRNLQVCVQDWVHSLPSRNIPLLIRLLERRSDLITHFVPYAFGAASLFGMSKFVFAKNPGESVSDILQALSISVMMFIVGRVLVVEFYRQMTVVKPLTFFKITNGDVVRLNEFNKRKTKKFAVMAFFAGTIVAGIMVNIFSSYIWDKVGR